MTKEIIILILSSSVISAFMSAILAPHINWRIEKNKIKLNNRETLIRDVRFVMNNRKFDKFVFRKTQAYLKIRPFLSNKIDEKIQSSSIDVVIGDPNVNANDLLKEGISKEINELEKYWNLI